MHSRILVVFYDRISYSSDHLLQLYMYSFMVQNLDPSSPLVSPPAHNPHLKPSKNSHLPEDQYLEVVSELVSERIGAQVCNCRNHQPEGETILWRNQGFRV